MSKDTSTSIPLSVPNISGHETANLERLLAEGWVSSVGPAVNEFEHKIASYCNSSHAVAVMNGTAALHISLLLAGVERNDEVLVPTLTFIAPVNAVSYCGAHPVFLDCMSDRPCVDVEGIREFLETQTEFDADGYTFNINTKRTIRAILPVHLLGFSVAMDSLLSLGQKYNIAIIEDAAESLGTTYNHQQTGTFGAFGCLSFNGNKIITAGSGGVILTNCESSAKKARHLSTQAKQDDIELGHDTIGFNYRMTALQAAVGLAQMDRIDEFVSIKRAGSLRYRETLSDLVEIQEIPALVSESPNCWLHPIRVPTETLRPLQSHLAHEGIESRSLWKPIHQLEMYKHCETHRTDNSLAMYNSVLTLPSSTSLSPEQREIVITSVKSFFAKNRNLAS